MMKINKNKNKCSRVVITLFKDGKGNKTEKIKADIDSDNVNDMLIYLYKELNDSNIEYVHFGDTFIFAKSSFIKVMVYDK